MNTFNHRNSVLNSIYQSMTRISILFIFALGVAFQGSAQRYLDKDSTLHNPFLYISAGGYSVEMETRLRLDSERGLGTDVSLEEDFKLLNDQFVFRTDAFLRVKKRSQFNFSYTSIQRSRTATLDRDISILDTTFYVGADVKFFFDTYYYALTYRYSFFDKVNWNAGLSFGIRAIEFRTGINGTLNENTYGDKTSFWAPAILVGLHGSAYLTPRLLGRYNFEYFQVSVEDIEVNILETSASLEYYIHKNVGIGVAYVTNEYLVKKIPFNDSFDGKVTFNFSGFSLLAVARF